MRQVSEDYEENLLTMKRITLLLFNYRPDFPSSEAEAFSHFLSLLIN